MGECTEYGLKAPIPLSAYILYICISAPIAEEVLTAPAAVARLWLLVRAHVHLILANEGSWLEVHGQASQEDGDET